MLAHTPPGAVNELAIGDFVLLILGLDSVRAAAASRQSGGVRDGGRR